MHLPSVLWFLPRAVLGLASVLISVLISLHVAMLLCMLLVPAIRSHHLCIALPVPISHLWLHTRPACTAAAASLSMHASLISCLLPLDCKDASTPRHSLIAV